MPDLGTKEKFVMKVLRFVRYLFGVVFISLCFSYFKEGDIAGGVIAIVLGLLLFIPEIIKLIALIVGYKKVKGNTKADSPKEALPTTPPRGTYDYEYEAVGLYRPEGVAEIPKIGDTLLLAEQPENPYDDKTVVAQRVKDGKIEDVGYMNKGKLRDMVRDFIESETGTVCAIVTRADEKLEVWIGMDR